ncbi:odorant receptor 63a isoform X2 [Anastrepha ludens]|uniref:odorant receptor 63a isoform X2 n=1 Tax=Anastrepha ludens TaxID=28586 RepID=UPI0023AEFA03|nr:odorant receptor 63a isoform X2 [Anastrepha ludens]
MIIETVEEVRERNYNSIKVLFGVSFALGVNLTAPSKFKDSLKIINVILVVSSTLSLYAHWCYLVRHFDSIPLIAETVCTALQTLISTFKMVYYLFTQRTFYRLVDQALTHELIRKIEIFQYDFPINNQLQQEIDDIMKGVWRNTRWQLLFYFSTCVAILCNYFFGALFVNLYHQLKQTPNYVAVSFDGVFLVLCQHAVGLLKVFNLLVLRATSPLIPAHRRIEYLRYTIFTYQRIAKYVDQIQAIFRHISLSQFVLSLIVFGFVLFEMSFGLESSVTIFIRMIMYIMAAGTQIVLYCYNGQQLTIASEEIPISFYSCNWYEETEKFKQLVRMMIMRTNRHFFLEVSWFTFMNLATLIALFRMSGSYFLLLRNLQEN